METNPLTIRAGELNRLPLAERRKILAAQTDNYVRLKEAATRRATKVIDLIARSLEGWNDIWLCTELMDRDDLLFAIEELLEKDAEEESKKTAPTVP